LTRYAAHVAIATQQTLAEELERLVLEYEPAAVIASDEQAVRQLHSLALDPTASEPTRNLVRRSLGAPSCYPVVTSKWATAELAKQLNIAVPRQSRINSVDEAVGFARKIGFPVILKRENSYGGIGSYVCRSERQLHHGYKNLGTRSWLRRRLQAIAQRNSLATINGLSWQPLIIQKFHEGQLAFSAAVVDEGTMVSGLTAIAEAVFPAPTGASAVIRAIDAPDLLQASRTLIAATQCSGFVAVDFIIDSTSGRPYLLEINPRVTPLCHLGRLLGTDLCAAFAGRFARLPDTRRVLGQCDIKMIALFPNEWMRDPRSPFLHSAYHDLPVDDPALIEDAYRRLPVAKRLMIRLGSHVPFPLQTKPAMMKMGAEGPKAYEICSGADRGTRRNREV
jgi:hypothetical protein